MKEILTYSCKCGPRSEFLYMLRCRKCGQIIERKSEMVPDDNKINWWVMIPAGIGAAIFILSKVALIVNYLERSAANHLYGH